MKKLIESIKTAQRKHVLIFIGIILICIPLTYSAIINLKLSTYEKESIPFTNNFLKLLVDEKYDELHQKYAINSGMSINQFKKQIEKLYSEFGIIRSYSYKGYSSSYDGMFGGIIGFILYYDLEFDNGSSYQGTFSIQIDKHKNRPISGSIFNFEVTGDYGEKYVEIRLIKTKP